MATQFNHSTPALTAGTTRTLLYGPVAAGQTVVVFSGVFSNIDNAGTVTHYLTLETRDSGSNYTNKLNKIPIPFGGASMCPKIVLLAGESLYVTADAANAIACSVEVLILS